MKITKRTRKQSVTPGVAFEELKYAFGGRHDFNTAWVEYLVVLYVQYLTFRCEMSCLVFRDPMYASSLGQTHTTRYDEKAVVVLW